MKIDLPFRNLILDQSRETQNAIGLPSPGQKENLSCNNSKRIPTLVLPLALSLDELHIFSNSLPGLYNVSPQDIKIVGNERRMSLFDNFCKQVVELYEDITSYFDIIQTIMSTRKDLLILGDFDGLKVKKVSRLVSLEYLDS